MKRRIIFILLILSVLISVSCKTAPQEMSNQPSDALSLWTDEAPLKKMLTEYMGKITDKNSKDFIPVENRVILFDFFHRHKQAVHYIPPDEFKFFRRRIDADLCDSAMKFYISGREDSLLRLVVIKIYRRPPVPALDINV